MHTTHTCMRQREIHIKQHCKRDSNNKERNVDSMFFPLKCDSSPPFRAAVPITTELFCLCGQLLDASSAESILHAYQLEFFNLHALKNNPKSLITAALFTLFG